MKVGNHSQGELQLSFNIKPGITNRGADVTYDLRPDLRSQANSCGGPFGTILLPAKAPGWSGRILEMSGNSWRCSDASSDVRFAKESRVTHACGISEEYRMMVKRILPSEIGHQNSSPTPLTRSSDVAVLRHQTNKTFVRV